MTKLDEMQARKGVEPRLQDKTQYSRILCAGSRQVGGPIALRRGHGKSFNAAAMAMNPPTMATMQTP